MTQRIVMTGDDFGLSAENNAGIISAYRDGVLSCTCLMVNGDAVDEALDLARQYPALPIGLHVAFSDTMPALPPEEVPMLVGSDGRFPPDDEALRAALWTHKGRQQVAREIAAQFQRFRTTGLRLDHVNTHRHVHMRHVLLPLMLFREAARWDTRAMRLSYDPPTDPIRYARNMILRHMGALYGFKSPDRSIGLNWSPQGLLDLVGTLPDGLTELYFHPTTAKDDAYSADLPTLLDDKVRGALIGRRGAFTNL